MHKYLRAAGFGSITTETDLYDFLRKEVIREENAVTRIIGGDGSVETEFILHTGRDVGIAAVTLKLSDGSELIEYYYPFFSDREFCSEEPCSLERHTGTETYAGLIDEYKLGISLIFYVQFSLAYKKYLRTSAPVDFRGTAITAFADEGMVLLPVTKAVEADPALMSRRHEEEQLLEAAIQGDPEAIETLTASDINTYNEAASRIQKEDLYSVVEQCLMPSGIECDQYSIVGEIESIESGQNLITGEELWYLSVLCNGVSFKLCIRKEDLLGEPLCGRRIKAAIWLLGNVDLRRPV